MLKDTNCPFCDLSIQKLLVVYLKKSEFQICELKSSEIFEICPLKAVPLV